MIFLSAWIRTVYLSVTALSWKVLVFLFSIHALLVYLGFAFAGEADLVNNPIGFLYYYMVTATTVGYGDLAPKSDIGRLLAAFFLLPGGIAIFTAVLGKVLTGINRFWRGEMRGSGDYSDRKGHVIVVGWQDLSTQQTLRLLEIKWPRGEAMAVLVAKDLPENPEPKCADYIRTDRLSDTEALTRAGADGARTIIIRGGNDDETLAAAMIVEDHARNAHVIAYFNDDRTAQIIKQRRSRIEAIGSLAEELMSRSARDPGSSEVAARLLSASSAETAYSLSVPGLAKPLRYGDVLAALKKIENVTLVGMANGDVTRLNCDDATPLSGGETLYYIGGRRIDPQASVWTRLGDGA